MSDDLSPPNVPDPQVQEKAFTPPDTPDGWLTVEEYSEKYAIPVGHIHLLHIKGHLIKRHWGVGKRMWVLDVPLEQHPTTEEDRQRFKPEVISARMQSRALASLSPARKKKLKEIYLPLFLEKAPQDRMVFSVKELQKILGIPRTTINRDWMRWGLVTMPVPEDYRHLSNSVTVSGAFVVTRRDLVRFFNGEWEPSEVGTPDDIMLGATGGIQALDGKYYKYDKKKVFPLTPKGFFAWAREVDLKVENKRRMRWETLVIWLPQREFIEGALKRGADGDLAHKIAIFSAPRGEGKTLFVSILTLFFFFNGYSETITLAGNSKDQSTFTHYNLCKAIIQHNPRLMNTPGLEVKEKYIALKSGPKEIFSYMQAIPTSVGLLPGTTRAVFTELHNLEEPKFFYDLWTSLRNVPNSMVLVDTTVAIRGHLVHGLWQTYCKNEDPYLLFYHYADKHYNPEMTQAALDHFRNGLPEHLYNMYFRNRWDDAVGSFFEKGSLREMDFIGIDGKVGPCPELNHAIGNLIELEHKRTALGKGNFSPSDVNQEIISIEKRLTPVTALYKIPALDETLDKISQYYGGCSFVVGVGLDRALRLSKGPARTVMTCVARAVVTPEISYYFLLDIFIPTESTLTALADRFLEWNTRYGWIDKVAIESYSGEDFHEWVSDKALSAELVSPTYSKQKPMFFSLGNIIKHGYLKIPPVPYYTDEKSNLFKGFSNKDDVLRDEFFMFNYVTTGVTESTGKFGSPEKHKRYGVQDDCVYSLAWAIYATHGEDASPSAGRGKRGDMIEAIINRDVVGNYV